MISFVPRALLLAALTVMASSVFAHDNESHSPGESPLRWWKGNLHTHSLWSDGDDFPEMIVDWYKKQGYQFLAISDHNVLLTGQRWINVITNRGGTNAFEKYRRRFGTSWVETRGEGTKREVRLKPLPEFRPLFEEPNKFLLIASEEITDRHLVFPVHINITHIHRPVEPRGGSNVLEVMQNNVNAVLEQRRETGQPMFPHLNHPNFGWGVTAEDLARVRGEKFFEVYNGHPSVHNEGDALHPGTDTMWDIALAQRLTSDHPEALYGIAVDDSHHYHTYGTNQSNSGRGWVMVHARHLTPESIVHAMEDGDFYASSGIALEAVTRTTNSLSLRIHSQPGVRYKTEFIGTRKGFNPHGEPVRDPAGNMLPITKRYSKEIGAVLATVEGVHAEYRLKGDELYVRARITSSKLKENPGQAGEYEMAWTQPLFVVPLVHPSHK